jgi:holo-[acyl-carrier protein] synthase
MLVGVGIDVADVARLEARWREAGDDFLGSLFTAAEIAYCAAKRFPAQHYAARFAAKEAFFKAIGVDRSRGLTWREVEVQTDPSGRPALLLHGIPLAAARSKNVRTIHLSLSHSAGLAVAQVILES